MTEEEKKQIIEDHTRLKSLKEELAEIVLRYSRAHMNLELMSGALFRAAMMVEHAMAEATLETRRKKSKSGDNIKESAEALLKALREEKGKKE